MEIKELHAWPSTPEDAEAIQDRLKPLMINCPGPQKLTTVAGPSCPTPHQRSQPRRVVAITRRGVTGEMQKKKPQPLLDTSSARYPEIKRCTPETKNCE